MRTGLIMLVFASAFVLLVGLAHRSAAGPGASACTGFLFRSLHHESGGMPYVLYLPRTYDPSRRWPLILFLHGSGESGTDGGRALAQGLPRELVWNADRWPFVVLIPQKPSQDSEWEQYELELMTMLAQTRRELNVDPARLILTGLSQGGHGAWVLGARHPELWAAVVPVCGYAAARFGSKGVFTGTARDLAAPLADTPVWAFHGEADDVVPVRETSAIIAALQESGAHPKVTMYPGVGHGSWERAYGEPELPRWLLAQRRRSP
jgi:predicted peptidase